MSHRRFGRVRWYRRGYHCRQVDHFLDHIDVSLGGAFPPPTAAEIRKVGFELVRHGYVVAEVDEHLDALEERVLLSPALAIGRRGRGTDPASETQFLKDELTAPYMKRFPRVSGLRRGYHQDDVDEFVDQIVATIDGTGAVTVEDVRSAPFRPRRGGYREDAVDEAMDRIVEHLLLVRRQSAAPEQPPQTQPAD